MLLANLMEYIPATEKVSIQVENQGKIYIGCCCDFRATREDYKDFYLRKIVMVFSNIDTIVIILEEV